MSVQTNTLGVLIQCRRRVSVPFLPHTLPIKDRRDRISEASGISVWQVESHECAKWNHSVIKQPISHQHSSFSLEEALLGAPHGRGILVLTSAIGSNLQFKRGPTALRSELLLFSAHMNEKSVSHSNCATVSNDGYWSLGDLLLD